MKCQAGWSTSSNQNCQRMHICTPHQPYGRKWRGTKEPLDEGERGELKSWLITQHSKNEDHGIRSHHFMANSWGNNGNSYRFYFLGLQNHCRWRLQPWTFAPWKKSYDQPRQHIKKQRNHFANEGLYRQRCVFTNTHVQLWAQDRKSVV